MVLLGEEAQLEARFGLFGDNVNLDARQLHGLHETYHMLRNQFGHTRWNFQMTCVICNLALVNLEIVFVQVHGLRLMQHRLRNHFGLTRWYSEVKGRKWNLGLVCLEIVLIFRKYRCPFAWNVPYAQKSIQTHPMELLDDVCHMESSFGPFGDSVSFGARQVHGLCLIHHRQRNHFGRTQWYSQVKRLNCKLSSEINLDAPIGTPR